MASSLAKEAGDTSTAGSNGAYSNGRYRKNECGDGETLIARGRVFFKEPICYGCG